MIIKEFTISNIPKHVSSNCSVYIETDIGIYPAKEKDKYLKVKDINGNEFSIDLGCLTPSMANDKFEEEKIIIYQDSKVTYMPQRKIDDSETEYIYRNKFYATTNKQVNK